MSDPKADPKADKPKKKGGFMMKAIMGLALLAVGGGVAYGLMLGGIIGSHGEEPKEDNKPKLVRKGEEDPFAPKVEGEEGAVPEVEGDGGEPCKTSYYSFSEDFTSNLADSGSFVQLSLAASTHYDGRVLMWMKKHELAIRSAVLIVLADTTEDEAYSVAGKQRLQKRLADAINKVLTDNEGFGGVDSVYFKSYIVQ